MPAHKRCRQGQVDKVLLHGQQFVGTRLRNEGSAGGLCSRGNEEMCAVGHVLDGRSGQLLFHAGRVVAVVARVTVVDGMVVGTPLHHCAKARAVVMVSHVERAGEQQHRGHHRHHPAHKAHRSAATSIHGCKGRQNLRKGRMVRG